jgi:amidohydrolase
MIKSYIKAEEECIISLRRYFHQNPEPSMQEYNTALKIEEELDASGIEHKRVGVTGVLGVIRGKKSSNKRIILRADIDALRIQDLKKESYASNKEGFMHACGHDAHTAALLGAAKVLKAKEAELAGEIYLFFQQGEEFGQGARVFIREGLLKGSSRVFGIHVASYIPVGQVSVTKGPVNASVDHFTITVKGQSAHVSTPQKGVDALYIASQIVVNLQAVVSRQTDPIDTVVVGIGVLKAGTAYNIVANEAVIEGTTRCFSKEARARTNGSIESIARQLGAAYGAEVELDFEDFASPLVNDEAVCNEVEAVAGDIVGAENVVRQEKSLGGDDFAEYLLLLPGMYAFVGTGNKDKPNTTQPHHHGLFDIDEQGILIAANLYVDYALQQLKQPYEHQDLYIG